MAFATGRFSCLPLIVFLWRLSSAQMTKRSPRIGSLLVLDDEVGIVFGFAVRDSACWFLGLTLTVRLAKGATATVF